MCYMYFYLNTYWIKGYILYFARCGHCVRGTTSLPSNHGEDVCRVCDGDGTSCLDCDNVVNGNKMVDFCGECLDPSDSSFNKGYT